MQLGYHRPPRSSEAPGRAKASMRELPMLPGVLSQTRINCPGMKTELGDALYPTRNALLDGDGLRIQAILLPQGQLDLHEPRRPLMEGDDA